MKGKKIAVHAINTVEGSSPYNAIDGRKDTSWRANGFYSWIMMDLGDVFFIRKLHLEAFDDSKYRYFIHVSRDCINWILAFETETKTRIMSDPDIGTDARYVRVTLRSSDSGQTVGIRTFEADIETARNKSDGSDMRLIATDCSHSLNFVKTRSLDDLSGLEFDVMKATASKGYLEFEDVDFGAGADQMQGYFCSPVQDKRLPSKLVADIEFRIDSPDGKLIGRFDCFRQWLPWSALACDIVPTSGRHNVFLILKRIDDGQEFMVMWLSFVKKARLPEPQPAYLRMLPEDGDFNVYLGLLHSHSCLSDGMNTPCFAYMYARDVAHLDFLGITDHSNVLDDPFDCTASRKFRDLREYAELMNEPGRFVALYGTETTWYNQFGHMNIYDEDIYLNPYVTEYNDILKYYDTLKKYPHSINQWNHPWSCGYRHLDLTSPYDPQLDNIMYLIELNQYEDPTDSGLSYYRMALENGYHVAPCGSQDNHKEDWGTYSNLRTGIVSPELTKECLLDSIRHRRVYYSCSIDLKVVFRVNGRVMGSRIARCAGYEFDVRASSERNEIVLVEVFGGGGKTVAKAELSGKKVSVKLKTSDCSSGFYYARITQDNGEFAVTSPVWIE